MRLLAVALLVAVAVTLPQRPVAYYNGGASGQYGIGAVMDTPLGLRLHPDNPVLVPVVGSAWEAWHIKDPYAVRVDGVTRLYYAGSNDGSRYRIGLATSRDGLRFERVGPLLSPGPARAWDDGGVAFPVVARDGDGWHLLYYGTRGVYGPYAIGHATSLDGLAWEKDPANPVFTGAVLPSWADAGVVPGDSARDGDRWLLAFAGVNGGTQHWQTGVAAFTDWQGPYVPLTEAPVITSGMAAPWGNFHSVSPSGLRRVDGGWEMVPTVFHCCPYVAESTRRAFSPDGVVWMLEETDIPYVPHQPWAMHSSENLTWVRDIE